MPTPAAPHDAMTAIDWLASRLGQWTPRQPMRWSQADVQAVQALCGTLRAYVADQFDDWSFDPLQPATLRMPTIDMSAASPEERAAAEMALAEDSAKRDSAWMNSSYVVVKYKPETMEGCPHPVTHLSIRSIDRSARHDWRDFQAIKDQLMGEDAEAVELYPARARLLDAANQFHLWCLPPGCRFPVGFQVVLPMPTGVTIPRAVQRGGGE